jgi:flap endonuclease-1
VGVDISALVKGRPLDLEDLTGRSIAIDAFNTLYQFLSNIRQPDGTPLKDRDGRVTSHLAGLFQRTSSLMEMGIRPVYVFDGEPPELKRKTLDERRALREKAHDEWQKALAEGDLKKALSMASRSSRLDEQMLSEARALLDALGVPWLVAPAEGEAQMAHMARKGDVWAGASQDFDAVLFGTPNLVRNLTLAGRRRLPSGKSVEVVPELVVLQEVLTELGISREQLVDMSILVGTDFNEGVRGIGPKKGLKLIREFGSLERIAEGGSVRVPEEFEQVREIFLEPQISSDYSLRWRPVDSEQVRRMLCDRHSFSVGRVDSTLAKLVSKQGARAQSSLDSWS